MRQMHAENCANRAFALVRALSCRACKPVGSAYVGSNPTPATRFRRSEPVPQECVTGFSRQDERLHIPSAVPVGHAWARSASRQICGGLDEMASDLRKHKPG
jgi:hypothetical protein